METEACTSKRPDNKDTPPPQKYIKDMGMHYLIQSIFVGAGLLAVLASLFDWDWFFSAHNTQFVVKNKGRPRARLFYAALGLLMIATGIYFFLHVQSMI